MRDTDEMDVIRHKAVSPDVKAVFAAVVLEPGEVLTIVLLCFKDGLPVVASLGYMMGVAECDCSCYSWHCEYLSTVPCVVNKNRRIKIAYFYSTLTDTYR